MCMHSHAYRYIQMPTEYSKIHSPAQVQSEKEGRLISTIGLKIKKLPRLVAVLQMFR